VSIGFIKKEPLLLLFLLCLSLGNTACSSTLPFVRQNKAQTRLFLTDLSSAWVATLEAISQGRDVIRTQNREQGIIETTWIDNTELHHFLEVFTDEDFFLRSRYKLQVQLREGIKNDQKAVLVRILKFQQMEKTFLGGWEDVESNGVEENTYLYRIGRLIAIKQNNDQQENLEDNSDRAKDFNLEL